MFARREPDLLRERLAEVDRDEQLGKLSVQASTREKVSKNCSQLFSLFQNPIILKYHEDEGLFHL